jgi:hypothetical protein
MPVERPASRTLSTDCHARNYSEAPVATRCGQVEKYARTALERQGYEGKKFYRRFALRTSSSARFDTMTGRAVPFRGAERAAGTRTRRMRQPLA